MSCAENCELDEGQVLRQREQAKLKRLEQELQPDMMERLKLKQDMEHEVKNNKVCGLSEAIQEVEDKHRKRMQYMDNNIQNKRKAKREELKKFILENAKSIAMLEMDDDQMVRVGNRDDWILSEF